MTITYTWREELESAEVNALHAEAFDHPVFAWDTVSVRPWSACGQT